MVVATRPAGKQTLQLTALLLPALRIPPGIMISIANRAKSTAIEVKGNYGDVLVSADLHEIFRIYSPRNCNNICRGRLQQVI